MERCIWGLFMLSRHRPLKEESPQQNKKRRLPQDDTPSLLRVEMTFSALRHGDRFGMIEMHKHLCTSYSDSTPRSVHESQLRLLKDSRRPHYNVLCCWIISINGLPAHSSQLDLDAPFTKQKDYDIWVSNAIWSLG